MSSNRVRIVKKNNISFLEKDLNQLPQKIPKIIHQMWIGPKPRPKKLMATWKEKHPDFEYIFWTEENLKDMDFECKSQIEEMTELNGKCDIMRWEILYKYGGVFIDADSFCIEKLDDSLMKREEFFCYENEIKIPGLISPGTVGFFKNHPLVRSIIDDIKTKRVSRSATGKAAWQTVGPGIITRHFPRYQKSMDVLPSYYFLPGWKKQPIHYKGHGKVYAHQEWGSTFQSYHKMEKENIPSELLEPEEYYSVLICSYNTKKEYVIECLKSIRDQIGHFGIELIWVNDGSEEENSKTLEKILKNFISTCRFMKLKYKRLKENKGIAVARNEGLELCSSNIIISMDSDDIMVEDRMMKQINYMKENKETVCLGGSLKTTDEKLYIFGNMDLKKFKEKPVSWFLNHPTMCYRKDKIQELGGYDNNFKTNFEDFDLELRILRKYGKIDNMKDVLVIYRNHKDQVTKKHIPNRHDILNEIIHKNIFK